MITSETEIRVKPLVIWTLQRTGGTNLARHLFSRFGCPTTQHEPFNIGRVHGHATERWVAEHDRNALDIVVADICKGGPLIKHCVEMVPWEVTESLAIATSRFGYRHLFLYRNGALDRLLSLHYARMSGIWGAEHKSRIGLDARIFTQPLPVEALVSHERRSTRMLSMTWQFLAALGSDPVALAYEDIYQCDDRAGVKRRLSSLLTAFGVSHGSGSDSALIEQMMGSGDQGTRDTYGRFSGVTELKKRLGTVGRFEHDRDNYVPALPRTVGCHPWVLKAAFDVVPEQVIAGDPFELGGVVVLSREAPAGCTLVVLGAQRDGTLQWGLPSQRMAREYPDGVNAVEARFLVRVTVGSAHAAVCLALQEPGGTQIPLLEVLLQPKPDYGEIRIEPKDRLIFDVGANDGADSWYYLSLGFRVVAVEAIPALATALSETLDAQVKAGRLKVENQAIDAHDGEVCFTINEDWTEWSSLFSHSKASAGKVTEITVPAGTLAGLIEQHGTPYYVKIDIEGGELAAVSSLYRLPVNRYPPLISIEVNLMWPQILEQLRDMGYVGFQLVRQGASHLPVLPWPGREGLERRTAFTSSMSGPFGRDLPAERWVGIVEVVRQIVAAQADMDKQKKDGANPGWYDVHAARHEWLEANGIQLGAMAGEGES